MAGDWIKMRTGLLTHPKIVRIKSACNADKLRVIGGLFALWSVFDEHSADGRLDGYDFDIMDEVIGFPGFCAAVGSVGWLLQDGETLVASGFEDHNGSTAKRRAMETDRKREARKVSATDADKKQTREEKRREDISVPSGTGGKPPKVTDPDEIIFSYGLPMLTNAGTAEKQARSFLGGLRKVHGDAALIDKLRECAKAKPMQPLEWLAAALPPKGAPPNKQEALEARNKLVADEWIAKGESIETI